MAMPVTAIKFTINNCLHSFGFKTCINCITMSVSELSFRVNLGDQVKRAFRVSTLYNLILAYILLVFGRFRADQGRRHVCRLHLSKLHAYILQLNCTLYTNYERNKLCSISDRLRENICQKFPIGVTRRFMQATAPPISRSAICIRPAAASSIRSSNVWWRVDDATGFRETL